jgi:hypothetical protein
MARRATPTSPTSVSEQVAALQARTLPADIPGLIAIAATARATSVRIVAASVAADILARTWLTEGTLPNDLVDATRHAMRPVDPAANPAILQLDGELGDALARRRVALAARDARPEVRAGARAALQRAALSMRTLVEEDWARPLAEKLATDPRVSPEMRAEVCRLGARAGWDELQSVANALAPPAPVPTAPRGAAPTGRGTPPDDTAHGIAAEAAAWAQARFLAPPPIAGAWVDEGADVHVRPLDARGPRATYALVDGSAWLRLLTGSTRATHHPTAPDARPRRLWVRVGAHDVPMLQLRDPDAPRGVITLRPATPREGAALLDVLATTDPAALRTLADVLPRDAETVAARTRATRGTTDP